VKTTLFPSAFLSLVVLGALAEGLWYGIPTVLVQINGLVLVLSALFLAWQGARLALRRGSPPRHPRPPKSLSLPTDATRSTSEPR